MQHKKNKEKPFFFSFFFFLIAKNFQTNLFGGARILSSHTIAHIASAMHGFVPDSVAAQHRSVL
jgi:hypothetical protein